MLTPKEYMSARANHPSSRRVWKDLEEEFRGKEEFSDTSSPNDRLGLDVDDCQEDN